MKGERRGHDNSEDSEEKRQVFLLVSNLGKLLDRSLCAMVSSTIKWGLWENPILGVVKNNELIDVKYLEHCLEFYMY